MKRPTTFRAFNAKEDFQVIPPGPMAQAFTFRAFGAENSSENWLVAGEVIESIGRRGSLNPWDLYRVSRRQHGIAGIVVSFASSSVLICGVPRQRLFRRHQWLLEKFTE